ncbi:MAG: GNAT family N-acetyltransferase [Chloroflexota bacterium]
MVTIRLLEKPEEMQAIEELQRVVWPGSETDIVPAHLLLTAAHNGGVVLGAFEDKNDTRMSLVGFVFGFPGLHFTPEGPRPKHCSHMLGVLPDYRNQNIGFRLKRAQWQWVRRQGLDLITWTYDPLLSSNAYLNITKLGAVCRLYRRDFYGDMRDRLNIGLPSDRFEVEWWVSSKRVTKRLSSKPRPHLGLAQCTEAGAILFNPTTIDPSGWPIPADLQKLQDLGYPTVLLVEIPSDFLTLKAQSAKLALIWRKHIRFVFEQLFEKGYLVTDFISERRDEVRKSFYMLTHEESYLGQEFNRGKRDILAM